MSKRCQGCGQTAVHDVAGEEAFLMRMAFRFDGKDYTLPLSEHCPSCRHQRRLAFRNELNLYHRTSAVSDARILSLYHERPLWGKPYEVMLEEDWRSDFLDPSAFGREVDFSRPFFEQYAELHKAVPRMSIVNLQNDNSPYTTHTGYSKNCYLLPCSEHCEECYYGRFLQKCKNCVDCTNVYRSELCYECFQVSDCHSCAFLSLSENCFECYFSESLVGCKQCLFCTNLRQGNYQIFNQAVSAEEFWLQVKTIFSSAENLSRAYRQWAEVRMSRVRRGANMRNCEHCSGDFLLDSRNCVNSTDVASCEDCADLIIGYKLKDSRSCSNVYLECELMYEMLGSAQLYHCAFGFYVFRSQDVLYSEYIYDSKRLFGCVGMTRAECCILNKAYSRKEYEALAARVVEHMQATGEWGKTLPVAYSPFGYNESIASDFRPLGQTEAVRQGFNWRVLDERERPRVTRELPPESIEECDDGTAKEVYACQETGEPFKITLPELEFYSRLGFPPPRLSSKSRHRRREQLRFPPTFRSGTCASCGIGFPTNVPSELNHLIRCERCYQELF